MKIKRLTISMVLMLISVITGCASSQKNSFLDENVNSKNCCEKLGEFLKGEREEGARAVVYGTDKNSYETDWWEFEVFLYRALRCIPPCEILPNGWQVCLTLEQIWPEIKSANVQQIVFCHTDKDETKLATSWYESVRGKWQDDFEVPKKAIPEMIRLLGKALKEEKKEELDWVTTSEYWYAEKK